MFVEIVPHIEFGPVHLWEKPPTVSKNTAGFRF
jgi:hypothetical protein